MKTQVRFIVILATIATMALAYLGGTFVSAETSPPLTGPRAPALTSAQWAAVEGATSLLLLDDAGEAAYLPLILRKK